MIKYIYILIRVVIFLLSIFGLFGNFVEHTHARQFIYYIIRVTREDTHCSSNGTWFMCAFFDVSLRAAKEISTQRFPVPCDRMARGGVDTLVETRVISRSGLLCISLIRRFIFTTEIEPSIIKYGDRARYVVYTQCLRGWATGTLFKRRIKI